MAGFASIDDLVSEITTAGKVQYLPFRRTIYTGATSAAGRWHECFQAAGTGGLGALTGVAGTGTAMTNATTGALPLAPATVTPDLRFLLSMMAVTPATTAVPAVLLLTDLLYFYPVCVLTGTPTTLNNAAAKPTRLGTGAGVMASAVVTTTGVGAASPLLTMTYTNSTPTGSRTGYLAATVNSTPLGSLFGGNRAGAILGGPFMDMDAGDSGVNQLDSYAITSGGTTGTVSFVLHRPIAYLPLAAANVAGERDFVFQLPSLPKIEDSACLAFMIGVGGSTTANQIISGSLTLAWG